MLLNTHPATMKPPRISSQLVESIACAMG